MNSLKLVFSVRGAASSAKGKRREVRARGAPSRGKQVTEKEALKKRVCVREKEKEKEKGKMKENTKVTIKESRDKKKERQRKTGKKKRGNL